jgi:dolichol-phosphate mannosyltransferase
MSLNKYDISIVIPVYQADQILNELLTKIKSAVLTFTKNYEIILVNDASTDNSWQFITQASIKDSRIKGINLSKNFGQHYAITAGLKNTKGEWVVVMDCDMQDNPDEIPNLYRTAIEKWDIVYAKRIDRKDSFFKKLSSKLFHKLYRYLSGFNSDSKIANFGIYNSKVIQEYNKMNEISRSFPSLIQFLGFNVSSINIAHNERFSGKSTYTFRKLFKLTTDVILSNSNKPLIISINIGFFIALCSFLFAFYNIFAFFLGLNSIKGFTSTIFSIWFVGGLNLIMLGIVGIYIGKIFDQVKQRQLYIISETVNLDDYI